LSHQLSAVSFQQKKTDCGQTGEKITIKYPAMIIDGPQEPAFADSLLLKAER